jgi:HlyD family secretion protein
VRRRGWIAAGALLVLLVAWAAWPARGGADGDWVEVKRGDLVVEVEVTGELRAKETAALGPPAIEDLWEFKIAMLAPEGSQARKGQPVLAFDASELDRKLQQKIAEADEAKGKIDKRRADAELARARDALQLAEAEAKARKARLQVDVPAGLQADRALFNARLELEEAEREIGYVKARTDAARRADEIALAALENQRAAAERRVREIRESIEAMTVKAPRDGTVVYVSNWRDEKKKVGDSVYKTERVIEIPDLGSLAASGNIDEADAGRLRPGQKLALRLDAHPDVTFGGRIVSIGDTVQRKSWRDPLKVVKLEIELDGTDAQRMRPGMRFRGSVETERVPAGTLVPLEAVFRADSGPVVYRKSLGGFEAVPVELGQRNATHAVVVKGIAAGDRVARRDLVAAEREGA